MTLHAHHLTRQSSSSNSSQRATATDLPTHLDPPAVHPPAVHVGCCCHVGRPANLNYRSDTDHPGSGQLPAAQQTQTRTDFSQLLEKEHYSYDLVLLLTATRFSRLVTCD